MTPILIGSRALNFWEPKRKILPETDWDVISPEPIKGTEWHSLKVCNNNEIVDYLQNRFLPLIDLPDGSKAVVAPMEVLALIKRSHLHRDLGFQKHISDYHKRGLKQAFDFNIVMARYAELYQRRLTATKEQFPQRHPKLNMSKDDFFDDAVNKIYDHDWLHELFAFGDAPQYTYMQRDKTSAWCEKDMWDKFSYQEKLQAVAEESYVISAERFLIPQDWEMPHKLAYLKSLDKVCTTLCSGWFRDFAIDNYPQVVGLFDRNKVLGVKSTIETSNERKYYGKS